LSPCRRVGDEADYQFRVRQFRAHVYAQREEDSVQLEQAQVRFERFELYLINVDGSGLEQVTDYKVFTSFPEFSPDGSKLVFVSSISPRAVTSSTSLQRIGNHEDFSSFFRVRDDVCPGSSAPKKKKLLAIGAVAGFQHDSVSNGLATMWKIGHDTGCGTPTFAPTRSSSRKRRSLPECEESRLFRRDLFVHHRRVAAGRRTEGGAAVVCP